MGKEATTRSIPPRILAAAALGLLVLAGLYASSLQSYLLFHGLAEVFSIVVGCCIFMIAWNSRRTIGNGYLLFVGIAYLFVAALDFVHALAYTGMDIFTTGGSNLATQLWVSGRVVQSVTLLIAPLMVGRSFRPTLVFLAYSAATAFLFASIFWWHIFPVCYVEGVGLTRFKVLAEYAVCVVLLASAGLLLGKRARFDGYVLGLLLGSIGMTIGSEIAFTEYVSVYGPANMIGHLLKIVAVYLIYKAIIVTGLVRPYSLLFRDLKQARDELEQRVRERTAELSDANVALRAEVAERQQAEAQVRYTKELLEQVFASLHLCVAYMDSDFNFIQVNRAYAEADGRPPDFFPGKNHFALYPHQENEAIFREVVRTGRPHTALAKAFTYADHPERGVTYWDWTLQPLRGATGAVDGVALCLVDVTERTQAEQKLAEYEAQLRSMSARVSLAEEQERRRIASELHDRIGQALAVSKIKLGELGHEATAAGLAPRVTEIRALIDQTIRDTRSLTFDLSPPVLYELGLGAAIEWLVESVQEQHSIRVVLENGGQPVRLSDKTGVLLFRAVQELLMNVVKHAHASVARIGFHADAGEVRITVEDDGVGFDVSAVRPETRREGGFGLFSIRERLNLLDGRLEIESEPGKGTRAVLVAPIRADESRERSDGQ